MRDRLGAVERNLEVTVPFLLTYLATQACKTYNTNLTCDLGIALTEMLKGLIDETLCLMAQLANPIHNC